VEKERGDMLQVHHVQSISERIFDTRSDALFGGVPSCYSMD